MNTALLLDTDFQRHDTGPGHPENAGRLVAIEASLRHHGLIDRCLPVVPRLATDEDLLLAHTPDYLKTVMTEVDGATTGTLSTGDTPFGPESQEVARLAVGGVLHAVDLIFDSEQSEVTQAFCAVRPPGHHATHDRGMGFCIFNNAAVAARHAIKRHGVDRVVIIDWDVHHGNGTQDIFYEDGSVFYFSVHQSPWYPGTGKDHETGRGSGKGTNLNVPLPSGSGMEAISAAFRGPFREAMVDYRPDLVIISAGFDSRIDDPLGQFTLTDIEFQELTRMLMELSGEQAQGRLLSLLEGGYHPGGLATAVSHHLATLTGATLV